MFPGAILKGLVKVNPLIAYYHVVSDADVPHAKHLYPIRGIDQFRDDLDMFLRSYEPITLHELIESVRVGRPLTENSFLLTFDDGFSEVYEIIAPILLRKGIPATFFLNTAFLDNFEMAHHNKISLLLDNLNLPAVETPITQIVKILLDHGIDGPNVQTALLSIDYCNRGVIDRIATLLDVDFQSYLSSARPYLTSEQVRKLLRSGFTIGAHSVDHPLYSALSLTEQLDQTRASVRFLRERFSLTYRAFAFPHGDTGVSDLFFQEIFRQTDVEVSFGTRGMLKDIHRQHFQRFSMDYRRASANQIVNRNYARSVYKRLTGQHTVTRI